MKTIISRLYLVFALLIPDLLLAQPVQQSDPLGSDNRRFVVFLHGGSDNGCDRNLLKGIGILLVRKGYVVRAPDCQRDEVGGPGVDFFSDIARDAAQDVANTVNAKLKSLQSQSDDSKQLRTRRQRQTNPSGYLGVWLF